MAESNRESALDRVGPHLVWCGITVVMVVATVVMIAGNAGYSSVLPGDAPSGTEYAVAR